MTPLPSNDINDLLFKCFAVDALGNVALRVITAALGADTVNDTHIDWGTGTNQVSAVDMPIADTLNYFSTNNVEAALAQLGATGLHLVTPIADGVHALAGLTSFTTSKGLITAVA